MAQQPTNRVLEHKYENMRFWSQGQSLAASGMHEGKGAYDPSSSIEIVQWLAYEAFKLQWVAIAYCALVGRE